MAGNIHHSEITADLKNCCATARKGGPWSPPKAAASGRPSCPACSLEMRPTQQCPLGKQRPIVGNENQSRRDLYEWRTSRALPDRCFGTGCQLRGFPWPPKMLAARAVAGRSPAARKASPFRAVSSCRRTSLLSTAPGTVCEGRDANRVRAGTPNRPAEHAVDRPG